MAVAPPARREAYRRGEPAPVPSLFHGTEPDVLDLLPHQAHSAHLEIIYEPHFLLVYSLKQSKVIWGTAKYLLGPELCLAFLDLMYG